jgi:hypothetical protein
MMKKYKKISIGVAVVTGLLVILPFIIPMQTYLHEAEKIASEKLGVPVTINSAHLFLLPSPRVVASDITVGARQEIKMERLVVIPTFGSMFSTTKIFDLNISKPVVNKAALEIVSAVSAKKTESGEVAAIQIRHIKIEDLQLVWPDVRYPAMNVEATLTSSNELESAIVETVDGKLKAIATSKVTPNGDEQLIVVTASKWTLPIGLPLLIDKAKLEMRLQGNKLAVSSIDIAMYGGKLTGAAMLNWERNWKISGNFDVSDLAVQQPSRLMSKAVYLSGNLFGKGNLLATAKEVGQLADGLQANFQFKVNNGVLHGLDLVKVASLLIKQNQGGGETQFDTFTGKAQVRGKQYQLNNLNVQSGLLGATGNVTVAPNKTLNGEIRVEVKSSVNLVAIPLKVSGTVQNPTVFPTKAALIGGALGTAVLPGAGTAAGIQAMDKAEKTLKGLFGN